MASRFCKRCERQVKPVATYQVNHVAHILGTVFLCGLWLPVWILACVMSALQGQCCPVCGKKV